MNQLSLRRPAGEIAVYKRGYAYLPRDVRREIGVEGKGRVEYFKNANCILLVRKGATREDVVKGLALLREDLKLRWRKGVDNES